MKAWKVIAMTWLMWVVLTLTAWGQTSYYPSYNHRGEVGGTNKYWGTVGTDKVQLPEITAPTGHPPADTGWFYAKDVAGQAHPFWESQDGTAIDLAIAAATLWNNVGDPGANSSISLANYTNTFTGTLTNGVQNSFINTGAMTTNGVVVEVKQMTGNPDANAIILKVTAADTDPKLLSLNSGSEVLYITGAGVITAGAVAIDYTDFDVSADGVITITPDDSPAACIVVSPSAAATTGLDVSSANLTNAISIGSRAITGTNFSVTGGGAITAVSANIGTVKQDAIVPATAAPTTITLNGAGAGGVTIGGVSTGTITLGGGATLINLPANSDMTISGGTLAITDTGAGPTLSVTNNTITDTNLLTLSATALTSGKAVSITTGNALTGAGLYVGYTDGAGVTGKLVEVYNGTGDVFKVERYGKTTIAGNASGTDALVISAGDLTLTSGKITQAAGAVSLNNNSNFAVSLATGTSTGAVSIGGGFNTVAINSTTWDVDTAGAFTGVTGITYTAAATTITQATTGAAQNLTYSQTGAQDVHLIFSTTGTSIDALQLTASAGGVRVSANNAEANQFYVTAAGTIAGNAINLATTDGGIILTAGGAANGDITITATDTMALSSSDWGISATGVVTKLASVGFDSLSAVYVDTISLSNAEIKALRAAPKTLVAAPGATNMIELLAATLIMDYGSNVLTVNAGDDLVIEYTTSGIDATSSIETTGWLTTAGDSIYVADPIAIAGGAITNVQNRGLQLFNTGAAEIAGNAGNDTVMRVKVTYTIHPTGL